ncbi:UDP-glucose 4-epimerase GalE [Candidatus Dependentiae bacterium]|nr:UDP-glucose 4-epimerase GalE [Candidatus Dependentiae bacterium]
MRKTILIPGGAGYVGSHTAYLLAKKGHAVIIVDKRIHNQKFSPSWATIIQEDFSNKTILDQIFTTHKIDAVMHFAAFIEVGESVKHPKRFYHNNVVKTLTLLDRMLAHDVKNFIFSSSCAVYGEPVTVPMDESNPFRPLSPYGKNKLIVEFALQDYATAYNLDSVSLRYFNAAGALPEAGLGEQHDPETHIIPLMIRAIKNQTPFKIFGTDYDTPDGSCIRDYIHVLDIAQAHVLALEHLDHKHSESSKASAFNLGSGNGFSVKEMIGAMEKICDKKMVIKHENRRPGDPAILLANPAKASSVLGWKPTHSDLETILRSALTFAETFSPDPVYSYSTSSADRAHR